MAMFYEAGEKINVTVNAAVAYHEVIKVGTLVAVTTRAAKANETLACDVCGVFKMEKATDAITQGAKVYLDADLKVTASADNGLEGESKADYTPCGIAWASALSADTTCLVKINA